MAAKDDPIDRLARLAAGVDAEFAAIQGRQASRMQCRAGCSACCRARLSITHVEEAFLRRGLETLSRGKRDELSARTREEGREMCPALDPEGRCDVYEFRPLICRSYGVPLRHRAEVPLVRPPVVDCCDLNFTDVEPGSLPERDQLDQTAVVESVESLDREYCADRGLSPERRIPIAEILRD